MKTRSPRLLLALAILVGIFSVTTFGQQPASVTWNLVAPDSVRPSTIVGQLTADTISGSTFVIRDYTGGNAGPLGTFMRWWPGTGVSWGPETTEVAGRYIQLTVSPKPGNTFTSDSISFWSAGGGTGNMWMNLYFSTDPTFAAKTILNSDTAINLPHATNVGAKRYAYVMKKTVNAGEALYFRIYPWYNGAASTSKYVYSQLAVISGTTASSTAVDDQVHHIPSTYALGQNYPNPFNPTTGISYELPQAGNVKLGVYNLLGMEVATLVNGFREAGIHSATWNATGMPSGVYFYKIEAGNFSRTLKMVLQK